MTRIARAVLREVSLQLREFFEISSGGTQARRVLLLTLEADGVAGWSECVAGETPGYSYETTDTAWHVLTRWLLPELAGGAVADGRELCPGAPGCAGTRWRARQSRWRDGTWRPSGVACRCGSFWAASRTRFRWAFPSACRRVTPNFWPRWTHTWPRGTGRSS